jgi:hypothetical protein
MNTSNWHHWGVIIKWPGVFSSITESEKWHKENNFKEYNMKQLKITPPEGYEIDPVKSNLEEGVVEFREIKIKEKLTYVDINKYICDNHIWKFIGTGGSIISKGPWENSNGKGNEAATGKQLEALLALNKLKNVANYLNELNPAKNTDYYRYVHYVDGAGIIHFISNGMSIQESRPRFNSRESAQQAIEILGEDVVKLALSFGSL